MERSSVLVVGGGIGGLAAAVALRGTGVDVCVLERAEALEPLGAGISLFPNAVRTLDRIGIRFDHGAMSSGVGNSGVWRSDGTLLVPENRQQFQRRYGQSLVVLHRAELQTALLDAIGDGCLLTGAEVAELQQDDEGVTATLTDGSRHRSDLLVGADGIDSMVRASVLGDGPPGYHGIAAYRGVVAMDLPHRVGEFWGPGGVFGVVPLSDGHVYWYATQLEHDPNGPPADLEAAFGDWRAPVPTILDRATTRLRHPLRERPTGVTWTHGRVTLLGDSAHPMLPFLGQGAGQAIEDAAAFSDAISTDGAVPAALQVYEATRRERAEMLVKRSRAAGRMAHVRSGWQRALRDVALRTMPAAVRQHQLDTIIGRA